MSVAYRTNRAIVNLFILMGGIIFLIILGCSSGGGGGGGGGGDETILDASEIADIWQFNFDQNIQADEEVGNYLHFSIIDQELMFVSVYEGAVVSNPVDLVKNKIYFKYQEGETDWDLSGTVDGDSIAGTWHDNYSESSGTWRAEKVLPQETLILGFYSEGDVLMDLILEDNAAVAEFYGSIPQGENEPVFTGYTITTEEEELEIVLDEKEQITSSILGNINLELTYNTDGTFNYELYSDGLLAYSASNLSYETTAVNAFLQTNINAASKEPQKLHIQKDVETIGINSVNPSFKVTLIAMKNRISRKSLYALKVKLRDRNMGVKSGFNSYARQNKEFINALNRHAVIAVLYYYHIRKLKMDCNNSVDPRKCNVYRYKTEKIWKNALSVIASLFQDLAVQLHEEYGGPLCSDTDEDKFQSHENCGTKVDCDDNNRAMNPGKKEICNDGFDNDCNGDKDCSDTACMSDPSCVQTSKVWKLVETEILTSSYEDIRDETCLGEGSSGEIISLAGDSISAQWYSFSQYCGNHFDINGSISFDSPPETAAPGSQVTLNTSGTLGGYQDCCNLILWFNYYTNAGNMSVSPLYLLLNLKALPITQVSYPDDGTTRDGWQGNVSGSATTTFTFPEAYVNDFWCSGRGNRGVGYAWHYQLQE